MVGTTISHHKVLEKIGEGGMSELYRGENTYQKHELASEGLSEQFPRVPKLWTISREGL